MLSKLAPKFRRPAFTGLFGSSSLGITISNEFHNSVLNTNSGLYTNCTILPLISLANPKVRSFSSDRSKERPEEDVTLIMPGESSVFHSAIYNREFGLFLRYEGGHLFTANNVNYNDGKINSGPWLLEQAQLEAKGVIRPSLTDWVFNKNRDELFIREVPILWDSFVETLDSEIVRTLDLKKSSILLPGYNTALSAPSQRDKINRAKIIQSFRFLTYPPRENDYEYRLDSCMDLELLFKAVDSNKLPIKAVLRKLFNTTYEERELIINTFFTIFKDDPEGLKEFLGSIPSSTKEPDRFKGFYKHLSKTCNSAFLVRYLHNHPHPDTTNNILRNLLENAKNNWNKDVEENGEIIDFIRGFVKDIMLPEFFQMAKSEDVHANKIDQIINSLLFDSATEFLSEHSTLTKLNDLSKRWHRNLTVIEDAKPAIVRADKDGNECSDDWHPIIIDKQEIDGWSFEAITTHVGLKKEGREMQHCVGGRYYRCLTGKTHIISCKDSNGKRATLELFSDGEHIRIAELSGYRNSCPPDGVREAANKLVDKINFGKIRNKKQGMAREPLSLQEDILGYNPNDYSTREAVWRIYQSRRLLPRKLIGLNLQELIEESGIRKEIKRFLGYDNSFSALVTREEKEENNVVLYRGG